jgi:hypothetical protein
MCTWVSVETCIYIHWFVEAKSHTPRKACSFGLYKGQSLPVFSATSFLSMGHYPYYGIPNISISKSLSALVFLQGFF